MLSVNNPEAGSATEEIGRRYEATPLEIGFNARYLLDIAASSRARRRDFKLADPGLADPDPGRQRRSARSTC